MLFSTVVLQTSFLPIIFPGHVWGDIVLMLILAGSVVDGFMAFLWWAVFAGIIYDLATYTVVGMHALIFLLVVYFVSFFSRRFSVELRGIGIAFFLAFVLAATIISRFVMNFFIFMGQEKFNGHFNLFSPVGPLSLEIFFNIILFFTCFIVFKRVKFFFTIT